MSAKRIALAGSAAFLVMFVLGGLWNAVVMSGFYAAQAPGNARPPEEASLLFIAVGYVLLAFFMAFLYTQSFSARPSAGQSFQFGALFGVIATLPLYLILYGVWDISILHVLVDSGWHLIEQGVGGLTLGLVLFSPKKAPATALKNEVS